MDILTEKQKQRIHNNQHKQIEAFRTHPEYQESRQALVLEPQRKSVLLGLEDGTEHTASIRKTTGKIACGDYVLWEASTPGEFVVTALLPRRSELVRQYHGQRKLIAANIDQIVIVLAAMPAPDFKLLDQYTVVAELNNIEIAIVLNKTDLIDNDALASYQLDTYEAIGYPVYLTSAKKHSGIPALAEYLSHETSILVGQSGVGKSSLIRELFPADSIRVGDLNPFSHGSHTTSSIRLYRFPAGGGVIDAPGIRDFAFWDCNQSDIVKGFIEFHDYTANCHFANCTHTVEPKCAVKAAVESGTINSQRYNNFVGLYEAAKNST